MLLFRAFIPVEALIWAVAFLTTGMFLLRGRARYDGGFGVIARKVLKRLLVAVGLWVLLIASCFFVQLSTPFPFGLSWGGSFSPMVLLHPLPVGCCLDCMV